MTATSPGLRRLAGLALLGAALLAVGACGRRGPLEAPPDASLSQPAARRPATTPRTAVTASPTTLATQSGAIVANAPDDETEEEPAITVSPQPTPTRRSGRAYGVPKEPFLLDPLL